MYSYRVFGAYLRSELPFPELHAEQGARVDWTLRVSRSTPNADGEELLCRDLESDCEIALYRTPSGLRLRHSCTGSFEIDPDGGEILWAPAPHARIEAARADVFGRVLAIALHLRGVLSLHASAVAFESGAIAFLAPKHFGKSTLAMALTGAGARLVTDDMLAITPGATPIVAPGVQSVRLSEDSAASLRGAGMAATVGVDGKHVVRHEDGERLLRDPTPLRAIYILSPTDAGEVGGPAVRTRLSSTAAVMSLVTHSKAGALLGVRRAPLVLERAAAVVQAVPVFRLDVARDLDRLGDVVAQMIAWHDEEPVDRSDSAA